MRDGGIVDVIVLESGQEATDAALSPTVRHDWNRGRVCQGNLNMKCEMVCERQQRSQEDSDGVLGD